MFYKATQLKAYIDAHPYTSINEDCPTILDQLFEAYQESLRNDPPDIKACFCELDRLLASLSLSDNNALFLLVCKLCLACEKRAFTEGLQQGAHLIHSLIL